MKDIFLEVGNKPRHEVLLEWSRRSIASIRSRYEDVWFMDECSLKHMRLRQLRGELVKLISQYIEDYYGFLENTN